MTLKKLGMVKEAKIGASAISRQVCELPASNSPQPPEVFPNEADVTQFTVHFKHI